MQDVYLFFFLINQLDPVVHFRNIEVFMTFCNFECTVLLPHSICLFSWTVLSLYTMYILLNLRSPRDYARPLFLRSFVRSRLWYFLSPLDGASVR